MKQDWDKVSAYPEHGVTDKLKAKVAAGEIQPDPLQAAMAQRFDTLLQAIQAQRPARKSSALGWLFASRKPEKSAVPRGLYIHGGVGRGKTMLMDLFFSLVPIKRKRRAHFHEFMADVHDRIHRHRQKLKNGETKQADPVPPVAEALIAEARLLCFDEFSVTDIADAMILSRLFSELFARGCILVATSNVEPDNLYKDGLNRGLFLPFVDLLKKHVDIVALDSGTDYRLEKDEGLPVFRHPLGAEADQAMDKAWARETAGKAVKPVTIAFRGREIAVPAAAGRAARFSFADLCEKPMGAADYLAVLKRYDTIFLDHIPFLGPDRRNETKRFINLVDTIYDHGARLFASAAAAPENLLVAKKGTEGFEFDRTVSRLIEIRSVEYAENHRRNVAEL
ncbi:cell division protein ZapE [Rhizobium sp. TRM96647]|uniref:cell division protein ZapE n=1 Tax=unclassified Rhizobium TaxID=2613769 RepID=UPI0021E71DC1|nr:MULTISPECIES: cell division protein ZapE [unclassified Rhizobium]MCV3734730.1 cell division protein ZapE [Rhizobium sp. TRM96647]MCV3757100.1 cell division protein ZapE [Rhizobium sp. TRM96650]